MLEGLDKVKWSELHHAYGEASDVPILIRKLLSQDRRERDEASSDLFQLIWHQGTIWEVTSYTVPFLYELIKHPETPDKSEVVYLLSFLATGSHAYSGVMEDEHKKREWTEILSKDGEVLEDEVKKGQEYERSIHLEVAKEFQLLYPYLFSDRHTRLQVTEVFEKYPEFKLETLPLLEKALASENDKLVRKAIESSIKILSEMK